MSLVVPSFSRFVPRDQHAWMDEDANAGFFRFDCPAADFKRFGRSANAVLKKKYRGQLRAMHTEFEKRYGSHVEPGLRLHFVALERVRPGRGMSDYTERRDVWLCFFRFRSEIERIEERALVRTVMAE